MSGPTEADGQEGAKSPTTPESAAAWDAMLAKNDAARCIAHKKNGDQCRRLAIKGATVCLHHGGAARHVRAAARARLENAADRLAKQLLGIAESADSEAVRLAAIRDALDRAGLKAPTQVDVEVGVMKPYERLLAGIEMGTEITREESRARRGISEPTTHVSLPSAYSGQEVLDVEPVAASQGPANRPHWAVDDAAWPDDATGPDFGRQSPSGQQSHQPGTELMTMEEANAALADDMRRAYGRRQRG
ncbi:hypothetical protein [Mycobacterium sp. SMC-17]|uniref:hypothetical protein n=1 Tax=Mycobacterium sp. SMC-17 TaxID=3381628 RepID=UPI0038764BEE